MRLLWPVRALVFGCLPLLARCGACLGTVSLLPRASCKYRTSASVLESSPLELCTNRDTTGLVHRVKYGTTGTLRCTLFVPHRPTASATGTRAYRHRVAYRYRVLYRLLLTRPDYSSTVVCTHATDFRFAITGTLISTVWI